MLSNGMHFIRRERVPFPRGLQAKDALKGPCVQDKHHNGTLTQGIWGLLRLRCQEWDSIAPRHGLEKSEPQVSPLCNEINQGTCFPAQLGRNKMEQSKQRAYAGSGRQEVSWSALWEGVSSF